MQDESETGRMSALPLPKLAALADPDSADTYLSLYADRTDARHRTLLEARARDIRAALADRAKVRDFDRAFASALRAIDGLPEGRGAAVFASPAHGFLDARSLAVPVETRLVLDSSPYIRPLAAIADDYEAFVLVLLDGASGAVWLVDEGRGEERGEASMDLIGRHRHGGMSQRRYQRHRQGRVEAFYDEIAGIVDDLVRRGEARRVIVAGPGHPKREFVARLPKAAAERVVAVVDVDFRDAPDAHVVRSFLDLALAIDSKEAAAAVATFRSELLKDDLATTGPFEVARAATEGRVALLLVLKDAAAGGAKCERDSTFFPQGARCGVCGGAGTDVDLLNEAVEGALKADSRVEFVEDDDFLRSVGGVGALLRW